MKTNLLNDFSIGLVVWQFFQVILLIVILYIVYKLFVKARSK